MRRQSRATRRYCSALLVTTVVARRIENSIAPPSDLLTPPSHQPRQTARLVNIRVRKLWVEASELVTSGLSPS